LWVFKILKIEEPLVLDFSKIFSFFNIFRTRNTLGSRFLKNLKVPSPALVKQPTKNWWFRVGSLTQFLNIYKTLDVIRVGTGSLIFENHQSKAYIYPTLTCQFRVSPKKRTSQQSYSTLGMGQHNLLWGQERSKRADDKT
jgi:hypothetical protein